MSFQVRVPAPRIIIKRPIVFPCDEEEEAGTGSRVKMPCWQSKRQFGDEDSQGQPGEADFREACKRLHWSLNKAGKTDVAFPIIS